MLISGLKEYCRKSAPQKARDKIIFKDFRTDFQDDLFFCVELSFRFENNKKF